MLIQKFGSFKNFLRHCRSALNICSNLKAVFCYYAWHTPAVTVYEQSIYFVIKSTIGNWMWYTHLMGVFFWQLNFTVAISAILDSFHFASSNIIITSHVFLTHLPLHQRYTKHTSITCQTNGHIKDNYL